MPVPSPLAQYWCRRQGTTEETFPHAPLPPLDFPASNVDSQLPTNTLFLPCYRYPTPTECSAANYYCCCCSCQVAYVSSRFPPTGTKVLNLRSGIPFLPSSTPRLSPLCDLGRSSPTSQEPREEAKMPMLLTTCLLLLGFLIFFLGTFLGVPLLPGGFYLMMRRATALFPFSSLSPSFSTVVDTGLRLDLLYIDLEKVYGSSVKGPCCPC